MLNKDKRSTLLSFLLGDGCLSTFRSKLKNSYKIYSGNLIINHTYKQKDYLEWKTNIISKILNRNINLRQINQNNKIWDIQTVQFEMRVSHKKFKAWRKFCYPNNKKDLSKILKFITNKELAVAIWLMDDGNCQATSAKHYGLFTAIRLHTCDQTYETHLKLVEWFYLNFNVTPKIKIQYKKKLNKSYYYLVFNVKDSLILWEKIRDIVNSIPSMKYKFMTLETRYQKNDLQPPAQ